MADKLNSKKVKAIARANLNYLAEVHKVGWFDGGCRTFASALVDCFPEKLTLCHASRDCGLVDHLVAKVKGKNTYIDADGFVSYVELCNKMIELEGCMVTGIWQVGEKEVCESAIMLYEDVCKMLIDDFSACVF